LQQGRALGAAFAAQVDGQLALERLGLEAHALLLAPQILEQRRQRHVVGDAADLAADQQLPRHRRPELRRAEAQAGDRRFAQLREIRVPADRAMRRGRQRAARLRISDAVETRWPSFRAAPAAMRASQRVAISGRFVSQICAHQPGAATPAP
jgi:hypothetical protein